MKKIIGLFSILALTIGSLWAQKLEPLLKVGIQSVEGASQTANVITSFDERYEGMKGNQYLFNDWLDGDLFNPKGEFLRKQVPLKFDTFNNEIIMKWPNGDTTAVFPAACKIYNKAGLQILNLSQFYGLKSKNGTDLSRKYMHKIYDGKVKLIKYMHKEIELADYKGAYNANRPYDNFKEFSEYFFMDQQGNHSSIKLSKKKLLSIFKNQEQELKNFISVNQLDATTEAGALSIFRYYDSL
jgi:hypothetical protein